jgi:DUF1365 family protein
VTSALYRGHVVHARADRHARRTFRYPVYVAAFDLADLPRLADQLRLFSRNRPNLFALHDRDYRDAGAVGIAAAHRALLDGNAIALPDHVRLITNPRVAGYVFNPVSFFLGYAGERLSSVVAEVNNTYGGNLRYVLGDDQRVPAAPGRDRFRHVREFFVSPFLHGACTYDFDLAAPLDGGSIDIRIDVADDRGETIFVARLHGDRIAFTDRALAVAFVRYPLMTAQVIGLIHWQALKLRWLGAPYRRPASHHRPHETSRTLR